MLAYRARSAPTTPPTNVSIADRGGKVNHESAENGLWLVGENSLSKRITYKKKLASCVDISFFILSFVVNYPSVLAIITAFVNWN